MNLLKEKYINIEFINLEGGYNHKTILLKGTNPEVVAKIFSKNEIEGNTEKNVLLHLNNSEISPKIYDHFEDDKNVYIIMEYLQGNNGQKYLETADLEKSKEIYKQLGKILSQKIHSIKMIDEHFNIPIIEIEKINLDELIFIPNKMKKKIQDYFNINVKEEVTLIHGDYGSHNSIVYNDTMKIIDWEWSGWGKPEFDISWVIWFLHLHYPQYCNELSTIFIQEYYLHKNIYINNKIIKKYSLYKVITILSKAVKLDEKIKEEWLRRLEWTLDMEFIIF